MIIVVGGQIFRVVTGGVEGTREVFLSLEKIPTARLVRTIVMTGDMNWYHGIAEHGYDKMPFATDRSHNWAFFPLFPLTWAVAAKITGEFPITGVLLSHLFFFLGLIFVYKCAIAFGYDEGIADRSLFYLAAFPTSYFFSFPITESLFLFLTAYCLYNGKLGRWWIAGAIGALASATRVTGIFVLVPLGILYWQEYGGDLRSWAVWKRAIQNRNVLSLALVPLGLASFMLYLYRITGNPLAFKDILSTWGRGTGFFLSTIWGYVVDPLLIAHPWDFRLLNFSAAMLAIVCGIWLLKRRQWALGAYTLICVITALSSIRLQSQSRYAMVLFPMFFVLATAGLRPRVDQTIRVVFIVLLTLMTVFFVAHFSLALS